MQAQHTHKLSMSSGLSRLTRGVGTEQSNEIQNNNYRAYDGLHTSGFGGFRNDFQSV